jgi:fatty acid desaturase
METLKIQNKKHKLPDEAIVRRSKWTQTNALISIGAAVVNLSILLVLILVIAVGPWSCLMLLPLIMLLAVRSLRALENLGGHEGAHGNWLRSRPKLNDKFANWFAAYWVFNSAEHFRAKHNDHHKYFGSPPDPCFTRYEMFRFAQMRTRGLRLFFRALVKEYRPYIKDYWTEYSNVKQGQLVLSGGVHLALIAAATYFVHWFALGWFLTFLMPFGFVLPIMRMFAEAEEHDYDGKCEFDDTYNNISFFGRWYLHPSGDAFHLLHHTITSVPHWRMSRVHREMLLLDPEYRDARKLRK